MRSAHEGPRAIASCSFCLKPNTHVDKLVAGPGVYICNECVDVCSELVKADSSGAGQLAPWERPLPADEIVALLPQVAAARALADQALAEWVRRARGQGVSWTRIGEALGATRQAAWERFAGQAS